MVKKKISLDTVYQQQTEASDKKIAALMALAEDNRIKYEAKFNDFRDKTLNPKFVDYKAYSGVETCHCNDR